MATSNRSLIEETTEQLLAPILDRLSQVPDEDGAVRAYELVDVEYVKEANTWYLRIYADKEGGIKINDCEAISRQIEAVLDEKDLIADAYILEVSSPGLTRALKKERDYARNLGKSVEAHLYKPVELDGEKVKVFIGDLKAYDEKIVTLDIGDESEELVSVVRSNLSVIKQYVVF